MVVTPAIEVEEAEHLFKNLSFHATATKVSSIQASQAQAQGGRYLFHVKDDPRRKSSLQSVAAAGLFKNCLLLKGYDVQDVTTFLSSGSTPVEETLNEFNRLMETAPLLFSRRDPIHAELTAAVASWPGKDGQTGSPDARLEFIYLRGMRFFGEELFTQRKVKHAAFSYIDLEESDKNLERLSQAISQAEPHVAYSLELRTARHIEKNTIQRLNEQKARIEYNLAYLQSISKPRPLLMRFNLKQLPALAAEIRSFPIHVILDGSIKYGFQATEAEPAGFHYLLVDPSLTARLELDPYPLWKDLDAPHTRFQLDPFWAGHYFDSGGIEESMVFVPESATIYPPLHSWDAASMGKYLRDTVAHWFRSNYEETAIPDRPAYIFDGETEPKAPISISVLDLDRLEPLHTRLGWINDNLVIERAIEKEAVIRDMARDITWSKMAETITERMESIRAEFDDAAVETAKHMSDTTSEMTGVLTNEINRVVRDSYRMAEKVKRTDQRLAEWDDVCADMEETLKEVRKQVQNTNQAKNDAQREFFRIEQEIRRELAMADEKRKELEEGLNEEIKKMQIANQKMKQRLKSIKL
jgi:hypothetical protein